MTVIGKYVHDPDANLIYGINWTAWLPEDTTITTATWTVYNTDWTEPALDDPTITATDNNTDGQIATIKIGGGTAEPGQRFYATCHVELSDGESDDRSIQITIKER